MRRRRPRRLVRVRHERKLASISLGLAGTSTVAISVVVGDQGFDDPLYTLLIGPVFPLTMFVLLRRDVRREVPKGGRSPMLIGSKRRRRRGNGSRGLFHWKPNYVRAPGRVGTPRPNTFTNP